jgi:serine/threonine protein kinase/tetratricopeptide (TPR) repeat protein
MDQHRNALKPGYQLHWYHIREILGQGGFGITYLADDTNLNQPVAIKEYLPVELAVREDAISVHPVSGEHGEQFQWGLDRFITEAQTLARFRHPNIVRVLTVFKENNTAYMVMEYEQGRPLHLILKDRKTLSETELKNMIMPILDGLEEVHAENFIHRDIKPPNIYIRDDQSPVLLDFGSARQSLGVQTRTLTTLISPGYAPFEQYVSKSRKQGPWTDIYALGATLYRATTGIAPPDSMERSEAILHTGKDILVPAKEVATGRYSEGFLAAIDHAMAFRPEERPQTISEWRKELDAIASVSTRGVDLDIARPVITSGGDVATVPAQDTLKVDKTGVPSPEVKQPTLVPVQEGPGERPYGVVKKVLKWLLVLFVIFAIALAISRYKTRDTGVEITTTQPAVEQGVPPSSAIEGEKPPGIATPSAPGEETVRSQVEKLLAAAHDDLTANRLTSPAGNNAVEKYRKALELEPLNSEAQLGLDNVVSRYLGFMDNALKNDNISQAQSYFDKAVAVNPNHPGIAGARSRLEAAIAKQSQTPAPATQPGTQQAETTPEPAVPKNQVPESERAELQSLKDRLRQNPQDREARQELRTLSRQFEENINNAVNTGNYALAKDYIREVQSVTSVNSKAWRKLNELMRVVEEKEARAGR